MVGEVDKLGGWGRAARDEDGHQTDALRGGSQGFDRLKPGVDAFCKLMCVVV